MDILLIAFLYFIPTVLAAVRDHSNFYPIFFFNLMLGWTAILWVAAFIWSLTDNVRGGEK